MLGRKVTWFLLMVCNDLWRGETRVEMALQGAEAESNQWENLEKDGIEQFEADKFKAGVRK